MKGTLESQTMDNEISLDIADNKGAAGSVAQETQQYENEKLESDISSLFEFIGFPKTDLEVAKQTFREVLHTEDIKNGVAFLRHSLDRGLTMLEEKIPVIFKKHEAERAEALTEGMEENQRAELTQRFTQYLQGQERTSEENEKLGRKYYMEIAWPVCIAKAAAITAVAGYAAIEGGNIQKGIEIIQSHLPEISLENSRQIALYIMVGAGGWWAYEEFGPRIFEDAIVKTGLHDSIEVKKREEHLRQFLKSEGVIAENV